MNKYYGGLLQHYIAKYKKKKAIKQMLLKIHQCTEIFSFRMLIFQFDLIYKQPLPPKKKIIIAEIIGVNK